MKTTRRQFLHSLGGLTGLYFLAPAFLPSFAAAQAEEEPHLLLLLRANGAWDVLMGMDAKPFDGLKNAGLADQQFLFAAGRAAARQHQETFLSQVMSPLFPHLDEIAIVNGLMMIHNNSVHEANRAYMATGATDPAVGFAPFQIARARRAAGDRVGFRLEYEQLNDGGYSRKVPLSSLSQAGSAGGDLEEILLVRAQMADAAGSQAALIRDMQKERGTTLLLKQNLAVMNSKIGSSTEGMRNVGYALAGLASGYLQSVVCDFVSDSSLDSHNNHQQRHSEGLGACFQSLSTVIQTMKETPYVGRGLDAGKKSLFDVTTVVVMSEFSRTAAPEGTDGTGHNQINNSCILFGKNIAGGRVVGQSDVYFPKESSRGESILHANLFDFKEQNPISKAEMRKLLAVESEKAKIGACRDEPCIDYIYPEAVWRTVGKAMGLTRIPGIDDGPILTKLLKT